MKITLSNQSKYDIEINCENQKVLLKSNSIQDINISNSPLILRASISGELVQDDIIPKKLLETLSNMSLDIDCTYELKNICDGMTLDITNDIYSFSGESFFLPFLYAYPVIKSANVEVNLIDCFGKNINKVLKLYRRLALFVRIGGDGIIIGIFSVIFELFRVKRLCKKEKIFKVLSKQLNLFYGKSESSTQSS